MARRCEASCRCHSQLKTSGASAVHAALPLSSSAQPHVEARNYEHQQVRGQSGPTFVDGGGPVRPKWLVSEKPTEREEEGQAETFLGNASGRFRVPIGATNQASRCLGEPPAARDERSKTRLHLRDQMREKTLSEQRRFQPVWFWPRDTLLWCDTRRTRAPSIPGGLANHFAHGQVHP